MSDPVPSDPVQHGAFLAGRLPVPGMAREDIWSIALPARSQLVPYTLTAVIRDAEGGLHVIDPGLDSDENWRVLLDGFDGLGLDVGKVRATFSTHAHADHLGLGIRLRAHFDAKITLPARERPTMLRHRLDSEVEAMQLRSWGAPEWFVARNAASPRPGSAALVDLEVDRWLDDGDRLDIPGRHLTAISTPGHSDGSMSVVDAERGLIFVGDHVLPEIHPGLGLGGHAVDPVTDYLDALARVAEYDQLEVWPGHFYRFRGLAERARQLADHQRRRAAEVKATIDREPGASTWRIASQVGWSRGWENLSPTLRRSALAQTAMFSQHVSRR